MQELVHRALEAFRKADDKNHHPAVMRLALYLGVSFYTIEHWRTGRRPIGAETKSRLDTLLELVVPAIEMAGRQTNHPLAMVDVKIEEVSHA